MKKLLIIVLISLVLIASCVENGSGGGSPSEITTDRITTIPISTASPETKEPETKESDTVSPETTDTETTASDTTADPESVVELHKTNVIIITNGLPRTDEGIGAFGTPTNAGLDYLFEYSISGGNAVSIEDAFSFTVEPKTSNNTVKKVGIINVREKYVPIIEAVTGKKFSELYNEDFFEKNVIIYVCLNGAGASPLKEFEYGYDTETKLLKLAYKTFKLDGIKNCPCEMLHTDGYFITVPKEAITVDGKLVPYEELKVEVTGKLTIE